MRAAVYGLACLFVTLDVAEGSASDWSLSRPGSAALTELILAFAQPQAGSWPALKAFKDRAGIMGGCGVSGMPAMQGQIRAPGAEARTLEENLTLKLPGIGPSIVERDRVASPCLS